MIFDSQEWHNLVDDNDDGYHQQGKGVRYKGESFRKIRKEFSPPKEVEIEREEEYGYKQCNA